MNAIKEYLIGTLLLAALCFSVMTMIMLALNPDIAHDIFVLIISMYRR